MHILYMLTQKCICVAFEGCAENNSDCAWRPEDMCCSKLSCEERRECWLDIKYKTHTGSVLKSLGHLRTATRVNSLSFCMSWNWESFESFILITSDLVWLVLKPTVCNRGGKLCLQKKQLSAKVFEVGLGSLPLDVIMLKFHNNSIIFSIL